jgi:hypothetical protein
MDYDDEDDYQEEAKYDAEYYDEEEYDEEAGEEGEAAAEYTVKSVTDKKKGKVRPKLLITTTKHAVSLQRGKIERGLVPCQLVRRRRLFLGDQGDDCGIRRSYYIEAI